MKDMSKFFRLSVLLVLSLQFLGFLIQLSLPQGTTSVFANFVKNFTTGKADPNANQPAHPNILENLEQLFSNPPFLKPSSSTVDPLDAIVKAAFILHLKSNYSVLMSQALNCLICPCYQLQRLIGLITTTHKSGKRYNICGVAIAGWLYSTVALGQHKAYYAMRLDRS
ncbi:hypothetical protein AHAS_Ahas13G0264100 [Arachis hypogaea]